jgi:hypothetical protein
MKNTKFAISLLEYIRKIKNKEISMKFNEKLKFAISLLEYIRKIKNKEISIKFNEK